MEEEDLPDPIPESPQLSPIPPLEAASQVSPLKTGPRAEPPTFTVREAHRFASSTHPLALRYFGSLMSAASMAVHVRAV